MGAIAPRRNMSGCSIRSTAPKVSSPGLPTWGTLIGLMHRGRPVYGMMAQPFTRERFYGDGKRAKLRTLAPSRGEAPPSEWATRALRARACASLREATLMTTSPLLIRDAADRAAYARVENEVRLIRYGGDCYAYCALAAGFIDLVIETNLKPTTSSRSRRSSKGRAA